MTTTMKAASLTALRTIADIVELDHVRGLIALDTFCDAMGVHDVLMSDRAATVAGTYELISDIMLGIEAS